MTSCSVLPVCSWETDWQAYFPDDFEYTFTAGGAFTVFYSVLVDFQTVVLL